MRRTLTLILGVALFGILAAVVVASQGADDPAGATGTTTTTETQDRTNTVEDNPARQGADDDAAAQNGVDISGPCDEAEHANDPRCGGQAPANQAPADQGPPRTAWTSPARVTRPSTPTTRAAPARATGDDRGDDDRGRDDNSGRGERQRRPRQLAARAAATTTAAVTAAVATAATAAVATTTDQPGAPARLPFKPMAGRRTILMVEDEESITVPLVRGPRSRGLRHACGRHGRRGPRAGRGSRCPTSSSST